MTKSINFPPEPTLGETHTDYSSKTQWMWNGSGWVRTSSSGNIQAVVGQNDRTREVLTIGDMITLPDIKQGDVVVVIDEGKTYKNKNGLYNSINDWQEIGSRTEFATKEEVADTVIDYKAISPHTLFLELANISRQKGGTIVEADKLVATNSSGKIDPSFLSITGLNFKGALDFTKVPASKPFSNGDIYVNIVKGKPHFSWGFSSNVMIGDMAIYDGTKWNHVPMNIDIKSTFIGLIDTPNANTGQAHKLTRVNAAESAIEYIDSINAGSF